MKDHCKDNHLALAGLTQLNYVSVGVSGTKWSVKMFLILHVLLNDRAMSFSKCNKPTNVLTPCT